MRASWLSFMVHKGDGIYFFRFFGWGLCLKDNTRWPILFSERNNLKRWLHVGKYALRILRPGLI